MKYRKKVDYKRGVDKITQMPIGKTLFLDDILDIVGENKSSIKNRNSYSKYRIAHRLIGKLSEVGVILAPVKERFDPVKERFDPKSKILCYKIMANSPSLASVAKEDSITMHDLEEICEKPAVVESKTLDKLGKQNANLFRENESLKQEILNFKEIEKQLNYELAIARQNADDWKEVAEGLMRIHANDERMKAVAI